MHFLLTSVLQVVLLLRRATTLQKCPITSSSRDGAHCDYVRDTFILKQKSGRHLFFYYDEKELFRYFLDVRQSSFTSSSRSVLNGVYANLQTPQGSGFAIRFIQRIINQSMNHNT